MQLQRAISVVIALFFAALISSCNNSSPGQSAEAGSGNSSAPGPDAGKLVVTFLETPDKHGQAIVVRTPSGKTYLVDAGWQTTGYDAGRDTVAPFLQAQTIKQIDGMLLSHPHPDHFGGAPWLIENFPVRQLIDSGYDARGMTDVYRDLRRRSVERGAEYVAVHAGDKLSWDNDIEVEVLSPPREFLYLELDPSRISEGSLLNNNSVILRIRHGKIVFLLPGDAYGQDTMYMLQAWAPEKYKATILAAPHHGFNETAEFARAITPEVVVASCITYYANSSIASPGDEATRVFGSIGAKVYTTAWHGNVKIVSDGETYTVTTQRTRTDTTPPAVTHTNASTDVLPGNSITATFSEPVICESLNTGTFIVPGITGTVSCSGTTASFKPSSMLANGQTYSVILVGGDNGIRDSAGNAMNANYYWSFTTVGAAELPATNSSAELFRYPYLQTDSSRSMRILWATSTPGKCEIRYKSGEDTDWQTQSACNETPYLRAVTGLGSDFFQHEAVLSDLRPGAGHVYNVIHNGQVLARNIPFETLREDKNEPVRFIAFGDSGVSDTIPRRIRDTIVSKDATGNHVYPHDFIVGLGDLAYDNGTFSEFDRNFFDQLSGKIDRADGKNSVLASRPFFGVLGNHEFGSAAVPAGYLASFSLPLSSAAPPEDAERYYSFDAGEAHFVVLDSMKFVGDTTANRLSQMLAWLDADLAATAKTWRIVFFHHAVFSYGPHGTRDGLNNELMRKLLVPILQNRGVQLVMFGHDHFYQRSKRMRLDAGGFIVRDTNCNVTESASGIVYVMAGNGGSGLYARQTGPTPCGSSSHAINFTGNPGVDYVAIRNGAPVLFDTSGAEPVSPAIRHGFVYVTISSSALTLAAYNYNGEMMDLFGIPAR